MLQIHDRLGFAILAILDVLDVGFRSLPLLVCLKFVHVKISFGSLKKTATKLWILVSLCKLSCTNAYKCTMHNIAQCTSEHEPTRRLSAGRLGWWGRAANYRLLLLPGSTYVCAISQRSLLRQPHRPCRCLRHHQLHVFHLQPSYLSWPHCHQHFWDHLVLHLDRSPMIGSPPFLLWALPFFSLFSSCCFLRAKLQESTSRRKS